MSEIKFVPHGKISQVLLDKIIELKMVSWPNEYNSQIKWIKNNLSNNDIHVMLYDGKNLIAYLNLITIEIVIDDIKFDGFGIGNVCAVERGKGLGKELMMNVNDYLNQNNFFGLLFCKDELVNFYMKNGWLLINNILVGLNTTPEVSALAYNIPSKYSQIKFDGKMF